MTHAYLDQENAARELIILTNEENCSSENCKTDGRHCEVNSCPCQLEPCETGCDYWTTEECVEWTCSLDGSTYSSTVCNPESGQTSCQSDCKECTEWGTDDDGNDICTEYTSGSCSCTKKEELKHCEVIPCECEPCPFRTIDEQVKVIQETYEKIEEANENIKDLIEEKKTWTKCQEKDGNWVQCLINQDGEEECEECTRTWQEEDWEDLTWPEVILLTLEKSGSELEQCIAPLEIFKRKMPEKWIFSCQVALERYFLPEPKAWLCLGDNSAYTSEAECNDVCGDSCIKTKTLEEKCYQFPNNYVCCE